MDSALPVGLGHARTSIRESDPGRVAALAVLVLAQGLMQFAYAAGAQFGTLRVLQLQPRSATLWTGIAFTVLGLFTGIAAIAYSLAAGRIGYQRTAIVSGLLLALSSAAMGLAESTLTLIIAAIAYSLAAGRIGYQWTAIVSGLLLALSSAAMGLAESTLTLIIAVGAMGLAFGSLTKPGPLEHARA